MKIKGFTLIEMVVVVAIVGILAAVAIPKFSNCIQEAKASQAKSEARGTFPEPTGFVVDQANLLTEQTKAYITVKATKLSQGQGPEVAVVTVPSIAPYDVETYSIRLAEKWKVGKKSQDNGIIILVALAERKIRIEVGRGLEGKLNDAQAGRIIRDVISPPLHSGDFNTGLKNGFDEVVKSIGG